jgi:GNAT superfamily N-acetyltransferase
MRPSERVEVEVLRDFFAAGGAPMRTAGDALAVRAPGPPTRETTRIAGLYDLTAVGELHPFFEGDSYWVSLDPEAGLDTELEALGFVADYPWQKFERDVSPYRSSTDLRISEADERFGSVFTEAYGIPAEAAGWLARLPGRPGWHTFAAYDVDLPVATGALFVWEDTGWLGMAGTLPAHRGRGAQGAILAARIDRARELGLARVVTETGAPRDGRPGPSYRNILRSGFEATYLRPNYRAPEGPLHLSA